LLVVLNQNGQVPLLFLIQKPALFLFIFINLEKPMNASSKMDKTDTIKQWVELYWEDLYRFAFYKTNKKEVAEDLVQECYLSAQLSFDTFKSESNPKYWLLSILRNKISDHYRGQYTNAGEKKEPMLVDQFFDSELAWSQDHAPSDWGNDKNLLDKPEFNKILKRCFDQLYNVSKS
jgi:RNA polymerase sigma factor (sigma-70 family)